MQTVKVSIIIPVFNEQKGLGDTIHQINELLLCEHVDFDVIFVNDGSTDNCTNLLRHITNPSIRVIHHKTNQGYGAALKTGITASKASYVCITDADGTYPNNEIINLTDFIIDDYSMVVGSRTGKISKIPLLRRFPKWILNLLANYLTGEKIPDINSGLRLMKKKDVERFLKILPDGFSFTTTITLAMLTNKLPVYYYPINYFYRKGKSKIRPFYDTLNFFQLIIRTVMYFNPLKIFIPLCGILIVFAIMLFFGSWFFLGRIMDVTFGVIMMTAVIVLAIGMLADLIDKRLE